MAHDNEVKAVVDAMKSCATTAKALKSAIDQALGYNSAQAIDWGDLANTNPALIAGGALVGYDGITPAEVSNLIGSLDTFRGSFWGTHGGNVEKLTLPIV